MVSMPTHSEFEKGGLPIKLEDLKVLRRSPDLLNNVKIGQGQLQLIMEQILFLPYITRLFAYCKGGNFNIHIWALFGYFIS